MTACFIYRIRADWSVVLQPALTTTTPGIYLARVVIAAPGRPATSAWQLRLHCGYALGDAVYPLPVARALATELDNLGVSWRADDAALSNRFRAQPALGRRARALLAHPAAQRTDRGAAPSSRGAA